MHKKEYFPKKVKLSQLAKEIRSTATDNEFAIENLQKLIQRIRLERSQNNGMTSATAPQHASQQPIRQQLAHHQTYQCLLMAQSATHHRN